MRRQVQITILALVAAFLVLLTGAVPVCVLKTGTNAASIRSLDNRGLVLEVINGTLRGAADPLQALIDTDLLNQGTQGMRLENVFLETVDNSTRSIRMSIVQNTTYTLYENATVTMSVPKEFFVPQIPCPEVVFNITPSAGSLDSANVPDGKTEINVNGEGITFTIPVTFDEFIGANLTTKSPLPPGLDLSSELMGSPATELRVTIAQNETYNIESSAEDIIRFVFPGFMMRTGISPIVGEGVLETEIVLRIDGTTPFVTVLYQNASLGAERAETMWDGGATITLQLLGDTWLQNDTLWVDPLTEPLWSASRPEQPFAFKYFLDPPRSMRPSVTINGNKAVLSFVAMPGFTLSNSPVTSLVAKRFDKLGSEQSSIQAVSIRVLAAEPSNVKAFWGGDAFERQLTESDVRRTGVSFVVRLEYNIFVDPPNILSLRNLFTLPPGAPLSLGGLSASVDNITAIRMALTAQPDFDIAAPLKVDVTLVTNVLETKTKDTTGAFLEVGKASFTIDHYANSSQCQVVIPTGTELNEESLRAGPLRFYVVIIRGGDAFVTGGPGSAAKTALQTSINAGAGMTVTVGAINTTAIEFTIQQEGPGFDIQTNQAIDFVLPAQLMASMEVCRAFPVPTNKPSSFLETFVVPTSGAVAATFSNITEVDMRTTDVVVNLTIAGDKFNLGAATGGFFKPQFEVSPPDPGQRGFLTSIAANDLCRAEILDDQGTAQLRLPANASYDAAHTETVRVVIISDMTASQLRPSSDGVQLLYITVVAGSITVSEPSDNTTVTERDVVEGVHVTTVSVLYDRFLPDTVGSLLRGNVESSSSEALGIRDTAQAAAIFADAALELSREHDVLTIRWAPAPGYDILGAESFVLRFVPEMLASGLRAANDSTAFTVTPSGGVLTISGPATLAGTTAIVAGGLTYTLTLKYDLWREVALQSKDFCVITQPCSMARTTSRRNVTVTFEPNQNFYLPFNRTLNLTFGGLYFESGISPAGEILIQLYVTAGRLVWTPSSLTVFESNVRNGDVPQLAASLSGDKFASVESLRTALVRGVECDAEGTADPYSFCGRKAELFATTALRVRAQDNSLLITLQADPMFDVFRDTVVRLRLTPLGLRSGLVPDDATATLQLTVRPSRGAYLLSTSFPEYRLPAAAIVDPAAVGHMRLTVHLVGERWVGSPVTALSEMLKGRGLETDAGTRETHGFGAYRPVMLDPEASATLSADHRDLTLQFLVAPNFAIRLSENIAVTVPPSAILGPSPPTAAAPATFALHVDPLVALDPTLLSASDLRTRGANLTFSLRNGGWDMLQLLVFDPLLHAFQSDRSPLQEPKGFFVHRGPFLASMNGRALVTNKGEAGSENMTVVLSPLPTYDLFESETITVTLVPAWTGGYAVPRSFAITVHPDFHMVEAVVRLPAPGATLDLTRWVAAVAAVTRVDPADVAVLRSHPETNIPAPSVFWRVALQLRTPPPRPATAPPFDNGLARLLLGLSPAFRQRRLNVSLIFFNATPPAAETWAQLAAGGSSTGGLTLSSAPFFWVALCGGGILLIVAGLVVAYRLRSGADEPGIRWEHTKQSAAARVNDRGNDEPHSTDLDALPAEPAEADYAGQVVRVATFGAATETAPGIPLRDGAVGVVERGRASSDDEDNYGGPEVPPMLYAGRRTAPEPATRIVPLADRLGGGVPAAAPEPKRRMDSDEEPVAPPPQPQALPPTLYPRYTQARAKVRPPSQFKPRWD